MSSPTTLLEKSPPQEADNKSRPKPQSRLLQLIMRLTNISDRTKTRLKVLVSVCLIASLLFFDKFDLSKSWDAALTAHKGFLIGSLALFLITPVFNALRWQLLSRAVGLEKNLIRMTQFCYVGVFFNLFLPSTVGGDVSRCYYLSKGTGKYLHALSSVLVDRAIGLAVLLMFATFGLLLGPGGSEIPMNLKLPIFLLTFAVFGLVPFAPQISNRVLGKSNWLSIKLNQSTAKVFWEDKGLILVSFALSILLQVMVVLCHVGIGMALGISVPLWYYFVFYPSVAVLGFVTPSINGIGIREWAYTYFLALMGVENSTALTFAIIWLGFITLMSLVGGVVYTLGHFKISEEDKQKIRRGQM